MIEVITMSVRFIIVVCILLALIVILGSFTGGCAAPPSVQPEPMAQAEAVPMMQDAGTPVVMDIQPYEVDGPVVEGSSGDILKWELIAVACLWMISVAVLGCLSAFAA